MTQAQVINLLMVALRNPQYMKDLNLDQPGIVRFTYQQAFFRVNCDSLHAEEVDGALLVGSVAADLLTHLLKLQNLITNGAKQ